MGPWFIYIPSERYGITPCMVPVRVLRPGKKMLWRSVHQQRSKQTATWWSIEWEEIGTLERFTPNKFMNMRYCTHLVLVHLKVHLLLSILPPWGRALWTQVVAVCGSPWCDVFHFNQSIDKCITLNYVWVAGDVMWCVGKFAPQKSRVMMTRNSGKVTSLSV